MKQRYTLEEVHRYQADLDRAESIVALGNLPDKATYDHYNVQIHVMREVLLRMHESLLKHGPMRPSLLARWLTAREIRKIGTRTMGEPLKPIINDPELQRIMADTPKRSAVPPKSEEANKKARRADEAAAAVMGRPQK